MLRVLPDPHAEDAPLVDRTAVGRVTVLVVAGLLFGIGLATFVATRIARLAAFLRRSRRR